MTPKNKKKPPDAATETLPAVGGPSVGVASLESTMAPAPAEKPGATFTVGPIPTDRSNAVTAAVWKCQA